jgi:hypothetical protein
MTPNVDLVASPYGPAIDFDGSNDYCTLVRDLKPIPFFPLSFAAWVYPRTTTQGIFLFTTDGSMFSSSHSLRFLNNTFVSSTTGNLSTLSLAAPINNWYSVVATYNVTSGGYKRFLYVNGVKLENSDNFSFGASLIKLDLGVFRDYFNSSFSDYSNCLIADARVYSRVLSEQEALDFYRGGPGHGLKFPARKHITVRGHGTPSLSPVRNNTTSFNLLFPGF